MKSGQEVNEKLNQYAVVGKSKIHGKGVFAAKKIKKGTQIIQYTGKLVNRKEGTRRSAIQDKKGAVYIFTLNKKYDIDGLDGGNGAHLINHSCDPNCEAVNYDDEEVWIEAIRDIKKGEEFSYDYGFEDDATECRCGAKNCKGKLG